MLEKANEYQKNLDASIRAKFGVHYTNESDILKVVNPTIIDPLKRIKNPQKRLERIQNIKILDPACGCGNFLVIAFRELKILELETISRLKRKPRAAVSPLQFYGMEINKKAIEIAKESLIALCINIFEDLLFNFNYTIEDLDNNIICADALLTQWPASDYIVGNPPFLGGKKFFKELGEEYSAIIRKKYNDIKGHVDLSAYWFRIAHDSNAKRIGFVAPKNISKGDSRKASLDYIFSNGGAIVNAITGYKWTGDANVHISIISWTKEKTKEKKFLDEKKVKHISSSLTTGTGISGVQKLEANKNIAFFGCKLTGQGFIIDKPINSPVIKKMVDGNILMNPNKTHSNVIDFYRLTKAEAMQYGEEYLHVKENVKPQRDNNKDKLLRENWWLFGGNSIEMRSQLNKIPYYFGVATPSKYIIFRKIPSNILPCEAVIAIASENKELWGILSSSIHKNWAIETGSSLGNTFHYTPTTCFQTFPFLFGNANIAPLIEEIEELRVRMSIDAKTSITEIYNQYLHKNGSKLNDLHRKLDAEVCKLYGFKVKPDMNYNEELMKMNQEMALEKNYNRI